MWWTNTIQTPPEIQPDGPAKYILTGGTSIAIVNQQLKLQLTIVEAEILSGLLVEKTGQVPKAEDRIELEGAVAEVLEVGGSRASRIRIDLKPSTSREIYIFYSESKRNSEQTARRVHNNS